MEVFDGQGVDFRCCEHAPQDPIEFGGKYEDAVLGI